MVRFLILSFFVFGFFFAVAGSDVIYVGGDGKRSLEEARDTIRGFRKAGDRTHKIVVVCAGEHVRTAPFVLRPEDSNVTYRGEPGARILGAREIHNWRFRSDGKWEADLPRGCDGHPEWFDTLWADEDRLVRARFPNDAYFHPAELQTTVRTNGVGRSAAMTDCQRLVLPVEVAAIMSKASPVELARALLVTHHNWNAERNFIADYDADSKTVMVEGVRHAPWNPWRKSSLYFVENLSTALDAPGEWICEPEVGKVVYVPRPGDVLGKTRFRYAVPGLRHIVELQGDWRNGEFVRDVAFEELMFGFTSATTEEVSVRGVQGAAWCHAAVMAESARNCRFERCSVTHTAEYAIWWRDGCRQSSVRSCVLSDLGAGGVRIGLAKEQPFSKPKMRVRVFEKDLKDVDTAFIAVEDCLIEHGGRRLPEGIGVFIAHAAFNHVVHNDIRDLRYSGVSVGYVWGYSGSISQGNEIGWNRIHHIGGGHLADMGGIYLLGTAFGTRVHHNFISDVDSYAYGGWGVYTDEGSEGVRIEDNIVVRTKSGSFHQHYGRDNVISNNVFAEAKEGVFTLARVETNHCSFVVEGNVLMAAAKGTIMRDVKPGQTGSVWKRNLYFAPKSQDKTFGGIDFVRWEKLSRETSGVFADPLFRDPEHDDWRVLPDSPTMRMGIRIPDLTACGILRRAILSK